MRVAFSQPVISLDPFGSNNADQGLHAVDRQIFDTLVVRTDTDYAPSLATAWTQPDATSWSFSLRSGVTFHDGTPVTADDVKASIERLATQDSPLKSLWSILDTVDAPDPATVVIHTKDPAGTVLANLTLTYIGPAAKIASPGFGANPVGSGPFKVDSFASDERVTLSANADYWDTPPTLAGLEFVAMPNAAARLTALKNGEIDATWTVSPDLVDQLTGDPSITVVRQPSYVYFFEWFNSSRPPFDNPKVRQAMWHAIDTEKIAKDLYGESAKPLTSPVPSTVFGSSTQRPYTYDPALAKRMLAEAGYPDGFSTSLMWAEDQAPLLREIAQTMISQWAQVGVTVQPVGLAQATWLQRLLALDWDMDLQDNFVLTGDADYTLGRLYQSTAKRNGYANPELDTLLQKARSTTDQAQRADLYAQASKIIWDEAVGIFPFEVVDTYAVRDRVQGFTPSPSRTVLFHTVTVSS